MKLKAMAKMEFENMMACVVDAFAVAGSKSAIKIILKAEIPRATVKSMHIVKRDAKTKVTQLGLESLSSKMDSAQSIKHAAKSDKMVLKRKMGRRPTLSYKTGSVNPIGREIQLQISSKVKA